MLGSIIRILGSVKSDLQQTHVKDISLESNEIFYMAYIADK